MIEILNVLSWMIKSLWCWVLLNKMWQLVVFYWILKEQWHKIYGTLVKGQGNFNSTLFIKFYLFKNIYITHNPM